MLAERFNGVLRAGWSKPAGRRLERGDALLVEFNPYDKGKYRDALQDRKKGSPRLFSWGVLFGVLLFLLNIFLRNVPGDGREYCLYSLLYLGVWEFFLADVVEADACTARRKDILVQAIGLSHPSFEKIAVNGFLEQLLGGHDHYPVLDFPFLGEKILCRNGERLHTTPPGHKPHDLCP